MQFKSIKAWNQLKRFGLIATLRQFPYKVGQHIIATDGKERIPAIVDAVVLRPLFDEEIWANFLISGFGSPDEWLTEALLLNHDKMPRFLVIVKKRDRVVGLPPDAEASGIQPDVDKSRCLGTKSDQAR